MRHQRKAAALIGVAALALTAACSGSESSGSSGEGADWAIPDEDPTATIQVLGHRDPESMQPVLDAFHEAHPDITVDYESVPFDQLNSLIDARIANQDGNPDVYWADQPRVPALSSRGYTEDLTDQFSAFTDVFDPAPLASSSFDGHLWSLPIGNSTQLMYYNSDLVEAAGSEVPSADPEQRMTWDELRDRAQAAVDSGVENGFLFGQVNRYYQLEPLPVSLGGSPGGTGEGNLTPDIISEPWIEAMTFYQSLFAEGLSPTSVPPEQSADEFLAGDTAYYITSNWGVLDFADADFEWGVAPHPYFEGGEAVTPTGSWSLAMSPFSDEKEAAAIFMRWMAIDDGGGFSINFGAPPIPATPDGRTAYFDRDIFSSDVGQEAADVINYETTNTAVPRLQTVGYVEFEEILGRAFSDIANGTDPATALNSASDELTAAWAKYK